MKWHTHDIPFLLLNLPQSVHDLMHHEDSKIVANALIHISPKPLDTAPRHHIASEAPALVSLEKSLDPMAQRSVQNIGLLLHDYLHQLPTFDVSGAEGEKLLEHWRTIMLEQPQRLSTAHLSHGHDEKTKNFWRDKLAAHMANMGISDSTFIDAWDDWQRASGIGHATAHPLQLQAMQQKQWQDLVIRTRLHQETKARSWE